MSLVLYKLKDHLHIDNPYLTDTILDPSTEILLELIKIGATRIPCIIKKVAGQIEIFEGENLSSTLAKLTLEDKARNMSFQSQS